MMTRACLSACGLVLALASAATAQQLAPNPTGASGYAPVPVPGVGYSQSWSSTAGEAAGHGSADAIRGMGEYNYNTAQAVVALEEAAGKDITNREAALKAYYMAKQMNAQYQSAMNGPRPTQEQLVRMSRDSAPHRPTPYQVDPSTGGIRWPATLLRPEFTALRQRLSDLYSARNSENSGLGTQNADEIHYICMAMEVDLRDMIYQLTPTEYISAKKFLESLDFESQFQPAAQPQASK